jgi:hypothetical protein
MIAARNLDRPINKLPIVMHKTAEFLKRRHGLALLARPIDDPSQPQGDRKYQQQQPT